MKKKFYNEYKYAIAALALIALALTFLSFGGFELPIIAPMVMLGAPIGSLVLSIGNIKKHKDLFSTFVLFVSIVMCFALLCFVFMAATFD